MEGIEPSARVLEARRPTRDTPLSALFLTPRLSIHFISPSSRRDEAFTPVSRILFYAIISLGTYQTIDAPLTGSGLFGLHPPRSSRYLVD